MTVAVWWSSSMKEELHMYSICLGSFTNDKFKNCNTMATTLYSHYNFLRIKDMIGQANTHFWGWCLLQALFFFLKNIRMTVTCLFFPLAICLNQINQLQPNGSEGGRRNTTSRGATMTCGNGSALAAWQLLSRLPSRWSRRMRPRPRCWPPLTWTTWEVSDGCESRVLVNPVLPVLVPCRWWRGLRASMTLESYTGGGFTHMTCLTMKGRFRDRGQTKVST